MSRKRIRWEPDRFLTHEHLAALEAEAHCRVAELASNLCRLPAIVALTGDGPPVEVDGKDLRIRNLVWLDQAGRSVAMDHVWEIPRRTPGDYTVVLVHPGSTTAAKPVAPLTKPLSLESAPVGLELVPPSESPPAGLACGTLCIGDDDARSFKPYLRNGPTGNLVPSCVRIELIDTWVARHLGEERPVTDSARILAEWLREHPLTGSDTARVQIAPWLVELDRTLALGGASPAELLRDLEGVALRAPGLAEVADPRNAFDHTVEWEAHTLIGLLRDGTFPRSFPKLLERVLAGLGGEGAQFVKQPSVCSVHTQDKYVLFELRLPQPLALGDVDYEALTLYLPEGGWPTTQVKLHLELNVATSAHSVGAIEFVVAPAKPDMPANGHRIDMPADGHRREPGWPFEEVRARCGGVLETIYVYVKSQGTEWPSPTLFWKRRSHERATP